MSEPRFFIDEPDDFFRGRTPLPPQAARHAGRSLRLAAGERVALFNGRGRRWLGAIGFSGDDAWVDIDACDESSVETPVRMTLLQALVSPDKTEWIVEKAVEAGVARIVLAPASRSVTKLSGDRLQKRLSRLKDIAVSAAEQCGRNVVPPIEAAGRLEDAFRNIEADLRLMLAPGASDGADLSRLRPGLASSAFAVGPEGGFSPEEIAQAEALGWTPALLGPRIFRTETAGLAAAVWINALAGDLPRP